MTQAQWKTLMGNNPSWFEGDSLSVERVNWFEACDRRTLWCGAIKNVRMHFTRKEGLPEAYKLMAPFNQICMFAILLSFFEDLWQPLLDHFLNSDRIRNY